jgi:hypothetical protein
MRILTLALISVSFLTLFQTQSVSADTGPLSTGVPQSETRQPDLKNHHRWELDLAAFKAISGTDTNQVGAVRFLARRFVNETLSLGADIRYWPSGSYPLGDDAGTGTWGAGGVGQLYLFRNNYLGAYLGTSLLWVPTGNQFDVSPEAGIKAFVSQRIAIGLAYWMLADIRTYAISFEPPANGKSRQSLGLELSVYL